MLGGPGDVQGATVHEDEDDGLAERGDLLEKLLLLAGKVEGVARGGFAGHVLGFAEDEDGEVGGACEVDGFGELGGRLFRGPGSVAGRRKIWSKKEGKMRLSWAPGA